MKLRRICSIQLTALVACLATELLAIAADVPHTRKYFYVGGHYVNDTSGGHVMRDQMYVEQLTPAMGPSQPYPIVFIHGFGQTGTNWLNKPDGNPGWASFFLNLGYECYLVDITYRGRSSWVPGNGSQLLISAEAFQMRFTATAKYNLFPQASLHNQWPGTGIMGDPVFDAYLASTVQSLPISNLAQQTSMQVAGAALLDRIGRPVILLGHSQGTIFPPLIADLRPALTQAMILVEPAGPPFQDTTFVSAPVPGRAYGLSDAPLTYEPKVTDPSKDIPKKIIPPASKNVTECMLQADSPSPRRLVNLSKIPTAVVTGEASFHAQYDWCTIKFLLQAGVPADHLDLGAVGIRGNGHMMFLEKNSDEIAGSIQKWVQGLQK